MAKKKNVHTLLRQYALFSMFNLWKRYISSMKIGLIKKLFTYGCHDTAQGQRKRVENGIHFGMHCVGKQCLDITMVHFVWSLLFLCHSLKCQRLSCWARKQICISIVICLSNMFRFALVSIIYFHICPPILYKYDIPMGCHICFIIPNKIQNTKGGTNTNTRDFG